MKSNPDIVRKHFPIIEKIANKIWADKTVSIWTEVWEESPWVNLTDCPYNAMVPEVSLVDHVNQVVEGAVALAEIGQNTLGVQLDKDVLLVAGILHDVSKMVEYEPGKERKAQKSELGKRYQHAFYSAFKAQNAGFPLHVVQIIINHTISSNEIPNTVEALCIYYSDMCAADLARLTANVPLLVESHK